MLNEGQRAHERGTDIVIGFVETHNRPNTAAQIGDLEVVPRKKMEYRGSTFEEMDVDAVLARKPERVLVDELAHTNVPGSRNEKRWQDVNELLDAGIDVISTVNVQHLESMNDVVEQITGIKQQETIPDAIVRSADAIELVDMSPEALRRRMAHGNIYPPEKVDASLANFFRQGNLGALRELALMWLADRVDEALEEYRETHGIDSPWETGTRRGRDYRRAQRRRRDPAGGPHGGADAWGAHRRARAVVRRAARTAGQRAGRPTTAARRARWRVPRDRRRRYVRGPGSVRPRRERHPDRARREPAVALDASDQGIGDHQRDPGVGRHRRPRDLGAGRRGG